MSRTFSHRSAIAIMRAERRLIETPLVSAGRFDTRAIMIAAVKLARMINRSFGSWQARMAIALRTVWKRAKAAMVDACAAEPFAIRAPGKSAIVADTHRPTFVRRSTAFVSGSRSTSHGW